MGISFKPPLHQGVPFPLQNEYRITSVLSHIGSNMRHGHYICESCDCNTHWLSFDNERVQQLDQKSVLRQRSNSAYILFYEYRAAGE
ncbi:ubiquitin carboxyl-terminal hydrolase 3-like isoform X2 [Anguilla anguilla]|uniref:ubiquitin carboxyl-terminal hydrolase 3-like isoform X2 n=1 Tax=Anguilla anguilla TaxID=7936 RepID=UPI0015ADDC84|nr:ubiquitin carboxyl-terminal hydrolase 3-like isoform X2 [Anguilla anguilla]